jgi:adenylylsulfate kinase
LIIWLTGQSGAGKTTIAKGLNKLLKNSIVLDGDEMRLSISQGLGFSVKDRLVNNIRIASLANVLDKYIDYVIVSVIAPTEKIRNTVTSICAPKWVFIKRDMPEREGHIYEEPENMFVSDHNMLSIDKSLKRIIDYI